MNPDDEASVRVRLVILPLVTVRLVVVAYTAVKLVVEAFVM